MTLKRIGVGSRMSAAVIHNDTVYLSGVVASDAAAGKSVKEQTEDILAQIDATLAEAGTDKSKLITATAWLTDMSTWAEMNTAWDPWVSEGNTPCRAAVESARLAGSQFNVEIMVQAAL